MTDFKFDEMLGKKAHSVRKINMTDINLTVSAKNVKPSNQIFRLYSRFVL